MVRELPAQTRINLVLWIYDIHAICEVVDVAAAIQIGDSKRIAELFIIRIDVEIVLGGSDELSRESVHVGRCFDVREVCLNAESIPGRCEEGEGLIRTDLETLGVPGGAINDAVENEQSRALTGKNLVVLHDVRDQVVDVFVKQ